jgi:hypothetical protein
MNIFDFFEPDYKKLSWFFMIFLIAQIYLYIIMPFIPSTILQGFIGFILNPATTFLSGTNGIEENLALPIANTINIMWQYLLATIIAREQK